MVVGELVGVFVGCLDFDFVYLVVEVRVRVDVWLFRWLAVRCWVLLGACDGMLLGCNVWWVVCLFCSDFCLWVGVLDGVFLF